MTTPHDIIAAEWATLIMPERTYHSPLPEPLRPWYLYTRDNGHSILVATPHSYRAFGPGSGCLAAAPVKAVLAAAWSISVEGYVMAELPYDDTLGLVIDPAHDEF